MHFPELRISYLIMCPLVFFVIQNFYYGIIYHENTVFFGVALSCYNYKKYILFQWLLNHL